MLEDTADDGAAVDRSTTGASLVDEVAEPGARLDRLPMSRWHRRLIVVVATGAFFDLYELFLGGVLGASLRTRWHLDSTSTAFVVASGFIGMFAGAMVLGAAADRYGRRRMFLVNLAWYSLFSALAAAAPNVTTLVVLRILGGLALGGELALVGNYLGEFMPPRHRGRAVAWMLVVGFSAVPVAAFLGGRFVATGHVLMDGWRWLLLFGALGAVVALAVRRRLPESPRWLLSRGRGEAAEAVVTVVEEAVRGESGEPLPPVQSASALRSADPARLTFGATLRGHYRRRTAMLWIFHVLQTVGYYGFGSIAPLVLLAKGFSIVDSLGYVGLSFLGYPVGAALAIPVIERCERRTLIVVSALAMAGFGLLFGFGTATAVVVAAGFSLTVASNVFAAGFYTYQSELFPPRVGATAVGVAYSLSRAVAAALPFAALTMLDRLGPAAIYLCSAAVLVVVCADVALLGPRSTGRSFDSATA